MKKVFSFALLLLLCCGVMAAKSEQITLIAGSLKVIDLPFVMQSYRPSTEGIVRVENFSNRSLRIVGLKKGFCELEVRGGGLSKVYSISVVNNISEIMKQLQYDLDSLPELEISINQDYIVIKGEVSSISKWEHLNRVLSIPKFADCTQNYARFRPAPEIMLTLQSLLEKAGFTVTDKLFPKELGEISLFFSDNVLTIAGNVYSKADIETVKTILATQNWLRQVETSRGSSGDYRLKTIVKLNVAPVTLCVDIVYVAISKQDMTNIGNTDIPVLKPAISLLRDFWNNNYASSVVLQGGLNGVIKFFASNGVTRFHNAGSVVFKNNDSKGGEQHVGGSKYIRIPGAESGGLQQVDYGLKLNVKGGLISKNKVDLTFNLSNSSNVSVGESDSFDQTKEDVRNAIVCELNNTVVLGGCKKVVENSLKDGLPILRNTPVLNWFVSKRSGGVQENELLILACPRILKSDASRNIKIPVINELSHLAENGKKSNKELEAENRRFRGWLSWLNWFVW